MTGRLTAADADYWGRSVSSRAHLALIGLVHAPLAGVGAMWLIVSQSTLSEHGTRFWLCAAVLIALGQTGTALYGRRKAIDPFWIAAVVLAGVVATAVWAVASVAVVLAIACQSDCLGA